MDELLKRLVSRFLQDDKDWLTKAFKRTDRIFRTGRSRYGFEWAIQTGFANFLLDCQLEQELFDVKVGEQEENNKKYDISFVAVEKKIIVEIKTIYGGSISYVKSDVQKPFPNGSIPFFLVFSDPTAPLEAPLLSGATVVGAWPTYEEFRCYLYKKTLNNPQK